MLENNIPNTNGKYRVHFSPRGIPLLYMGQPIPDCSIITLENYTKWYDMHLVNPDGTVSTVDARILHDAQEIDGDALWIDHVYHPRLLHRVAEILKAEVDERAIEVAGGRWILEKFDFDNLKILETPKAPFATTGSFAAGSGGGNGAGLGQHYLVSGMVSGGGSGGAGEHNGRNRSNDQQLSAERMRRAQRQLKQLDFHDPNFDKD